MRAYLLIDCAIRLPDRQHYAHTHTHTHNTGRCQYMDTHGHRCEMSTNATCLLCMRHAYMDRVSKNTKRIQADASTLPSP